MPGPRQRTVSTECRTMGHASCKKILEDTGRGQWRIASIVHYVYGARRIEVIAKY